jgi:hypothetical protein
MERNNFSIFLTKLKRNRDGEIFLFFTILFLFSTIYIGINYSENKINEDDYLVYDLKGDKSTTTYTLLKGGVNYTGQIRVASTTFYLKANVVINFNGTLVKEQKFDIYDDYSDSLYEYVNFVCEAKSEVNVSITIDLINEYRYRNSFEIKILEEISPNLIERDSLTDDLLIGSLLMLIVSPGMMTISFSGSHLRSDKFMGISYETRKDRKNIKSEFYSLLNVQIMYDVPDYYSLRKENKQSLLVQNSKQYFSMLDEMEVGFSNDRKTNLIPGSGMKKENIPENNHFKSYIRLQELANAIIELNKKSFNLGYHLIYGFFLSFALIFAFWTMSDYIFFILLGYLMLLCILQSTQGKTKFIVDEAKATIGSKYLTKKINNLMDECF